MNRIFLLFIGLALMLGISCKKDPVVPPDADEYGKISLQFTHYVANSPMVIDTLIYVNAAGNEYLVNEIQYFISDVVLVRDDDTEVMIDDWEDIHYVDTDIPSTQSWTVADPVLTGSYKALRFTFGISAAKNISYMYVNPPEKDMFWPEYLGGGYHYMKLNGKWLDTNAMVVPFNFHLGIGQIYAGGVIDVDSITGFVHNNFEVTLQGTSFSVAKDQTTPLEIRMNVASWFETPHVWDHNVWGPYIMQNQAAMLQCKENGFDVFSLH